jgi:HAD superfamily, subfamily IIIB (Acid phosphatase)
MAMTQSPADTSAAFAGERGRLRRSAPLIVGSLIAAAGLAFGSVSVASAQAGRHAPPPTIEQQAAAVKAQDAYTPADGNKELNVNVLEDQVEHYYGSASATYPGVGTVTIPSATSNYAKQMKRIVAVAEAYLAHAASRYHGKGTGRPQSQTAATIKDLTSAGYTAPAAGHLFLKPSSPPSYLHCAAAPTCTTTEYKSGTRKYISSLGYTITADFGDQYSDLLGGDAGHQVKLPNPMYYIP